MKKNITLIAGGTGLSTLLSELLKLDQNVSIILNAYDDGKSTGKIKEFFNILGPSDVSKNLLNSIYSDSSESLKNCKEFLEYRFQSLKNPKLIWSKFKNQQFDFDYLSKLYQNLSVYYQKKFSLYIKNFVNEVIKYNGEKKLGFFDLSDFAMRNIIFVGAYFQEGDYQKTINKLGELLKIKNKILINNDKNLWLMAQTEKGSILDRESAIVNEKLDEKIDKIFLLKNKDRQKVINEKDLNKKIDLIKHYNCEIELKKNCIDNLLNANYIVFAPSTFDSSIFPTLISKSFCESYLKSNAIKIFVSNLVRERTTYPLSFTLNKIETIFRDQTKKDIQISKIFDYVIINQHGFISYAKKENHYIPVDENELKKMQVNLVKKSFESEKDFTKHNGRLLAKTILSLEKPKNAALEKNILYQKISSPLISYDSQVRINKLIEKQIDKNDFSKHLSLVAPIITASGEQKRFKSKTPKSLFLINQVPALIHIARVAKTINSNFIVTCNPKNYTPIRNALNSYNYNSVELVSAEAKGTGIAILEANKVIPKNIKWLLILWGDAPNLQQSTIKKIIQLSKIFNKYNIFLPTSWEKNPYAGVNRNIDGKVISLFQTKNNPDQIRSFGEHDANAFLVRRSVIIRTLQYLQKLKNNKILDLNQSLSYLLQNGSKAIAYCCASEEEAASYNTVNEAIEVAQKQLKIKNRKVEKFCFNQFYDKELANLEKKIEKKKNEEIIDKIKNQKNLKIKLIYGNNALKYKALALDLDGTIRDEQVVSKNIIEKIKLLATNNFFISIITAASQQSLKSNFIEPLLETKPSKLVLERIFLYPFNGALGYRLISPKKIFYDYEIPHYLVSKSIELISKNILSIDDDYKVATHKITLWINKANNGNITYEHFNLIFNKSKLPLKARLGSENKKNKIFIITLDQVDKALALNNFSEQIQISTKQIIKIADLSEKGSVDFELLRGRGSFCTNENSRILREDVVYLPRICHKRGVAATQWLLAELISVIDSNKDTLL